MEVYSGKGLQSADFASKDDLQVGDQVVACGLVKKYNSTPEFDKNNYLVSFNRPQKADPELSFGDIEGYEITIGEIFQAPNLGMADNFTEAVTYASSDPAVATISQQGVVEVVGAGTTTISATFAGNDEWKVSSASYTLTVVDPNAKGTINNPFTVDDVINGDAQGRKDIFVKGFIVGEFRSKTLDPYTSEFTTDANFTIASEFTSSPTAGASIPVQLGTDALKSAWGCKTNGTLLLGYEVLLKGNGETYFSVNAIKGTSSIEAVSVPANVSDAGFATFCSREALDFSNSGIEAYIATVDGETINFTQKNQIPAGEGLLLRSTNGAVSVNVPVLGPNDQADDVVGNALVGVLEKIASLSSTDPNNGANYILNNGKNGLGFYKANGQKVAAGKAYLHVSGNSARTFIGFGGETGISTVENTVAKENAIFNLSGQRVMQPTKGLYIVNGKKVVLK